MDIVNQLAEALGHAIRQNEHDMLLTGDEIRDARKVLARYYVMGPGDYTTEECPPGFVAKATETGSCDGCHFHDKRKECNAAPACAESDRKDGKKRIFLLSTGGQA